MRDERVKKIAVTAMLSAAAYAVVFFIRIPLVLFLKYDPKDAVIAIGGFIFGPFTAFLISLVVSLVEMVTISDNGIIGCIMNILSSCAFSCTAAFVYKKKRTAAGAVIGLVCGVACMVCVMLLWNYIITPIYMKMPREAVAALLPTVFLPFNLVKGGLNAGITLLLYKSVVTGLRKSNLIAPIKTGEKHGINKGVMIAAFAAIITCILFILVLKGVF